MTEPSRANEEAPALRRLVGILGLVLILVSQYIIFALPVADEKLPPPIIFLSFAGLVIFLASFFISRKKTMPARIGRLKIPETGLWILASAFFSTLAAFSMVLFEKYGEFIYIPVLFTWFMSGLFYLYAFIPSAGVTLPSIKEWLKSHRKELLLLCGITLVAGFLRFYTLGVYPRVLDGDEGRMGMFALSSKAGTYANPFALWENFGALYLQAINLIFKLFGATAFSLRFLPALSGTLAVPALYLFARYIAGKRVAFISAFLLAVSHTHINFSRIASVGYIHATLLVPLELYLLLSGLEKKQTWRTAAAGVILAIHFSIYLTSQIIVALVLVFMLIALVFFRRWFRPALRQAAAFWGGFILLLLPELLYIIRNPHSFFDRLSQDGTFQSGWLALTMASTGQSAPQILAGRVLHAFLALIYYPARDFYGSNFPMLTLFATLFFLAGLVIVLLRLRSPGMLLLNGYLWAPILAVGLFSIPPSADSYRMLIVIPAALVLAGIGIEETLKLLGVTWAGNRRTYAFLSTILLATLAIFNLWAYFGDFVSECRYGGDTTGRFASYLGSTTKLLPLDSPAYLLSDAIYFHGSHASTDFLSGNRTITNVPDPIENWQGISGDTIIANPARIPELENWVREHPGGRITYVRDCSNVILASYTLP